MRIGRLFSTGKNLINKQNLQGNTPLHIACMRGNLAAAESLLKAGADINVRNQFGETPLCCAYEKRDITRLLLGHGASMSLDSNGNSLLHLACYSGDIQLLNRIIDNEKKVILPSEYSTGDENDQK